MASKQLIYNKTILKSVYRSYTALNKKGCIKYDEYKKIVLEGKESTETYLKNAYKANMFVINTAYEGYNPLVISVIHKILFDKQISNENLKEFYKKRENEKDIIDVIINTLKELKMEKEEKYKFSYMIITYLLYTSYKRIFNMRWKYFDSLCEIITKTNEYEKIRHIIEEEIKNNKELDEKYYDSLEPLNEKQVKQFLNERKEEMKEKYQIEHLYLFGSFAKKNYRIDSDIDIALVLKANKTYEQKKQIIEDFSKYILENLKRRADVMEYVEEILKDEVHIKIY